MWPACSNSQAKATLATQGQAATVRRGEEVQGVCFLALERSKKGTSIAPVTDRFTNTLPNIITSDFLLPPSLFMQSSRIYVPGGIIRQRRLLFLEELVVPWERKPIRQVIQDNCELL